MNANVVRFDGRSVLRTWSFLLAFPVCAACTSGTDTGGGGTTTVPVASVTVSPTNVTLIVPQTQQVTATTRDSANNVLTGRTVTWTSSAATFASVSATGLVTALAVGPATITATSEGRSGSATVTVAAGPTGAECATPGAGWIWCDDFETDRLASYFEVDNAGGAFTRIAGVGRNASFGMRAQWIPARLNAGALHLAFGKTPGAYFRAVDAGTAIYRDVYWRMYVRLQPGWTGGGADKLSRAMSLVGTNFSQAMIAHVWAGSSPNQDYLVLDPASGTDLAGVVQTTQYNDFANFRWLGAARSNTALFANAQAGNWFCVEAHARLNDAGQSNGLFELWINGTAEPSRTGLNWLGSYATYGINAVYFENYWNAGSPATQERYFDNIVVSTQRINC